MTDLVYNIFYTDDDTDDQEVFREIVAEINEDILIFTQNNGEELMNVLRNPPPSAHLIFLDLNMPVKNGYDVLKEIRQSERLKNLPVIVFSTSNDVASIETTRSLGATLYINKPNSYNDLKKILRHILSIDWEMFKTAGTDFVYTP
ncbi:MAG: response regulator [Bacteroidetes bacterium]|nr:response regulator [Bacteroidota bacterium]